MIGIDKFIFSPLEEMMGSIKIIGQKSKGKWRVDITKRREYNIAVFGCSFTYGWGVEEEESWPYLLGKLFGDKVQLWNFGIPGTSMEMIAKLALKVQEDLNPDLIIVWWPETLRRVWIKEDGSPLQWTWEGFIYDRVGREAEHESLTILSHDLNDYSYTLSQAALINKTANRCINIFQVDWYDIKFKEELSKYYGIEEVIDCLLAKDYQLPEGRERKRWMDWDRDGRWSISKKDMHPNARWHNKFAKHLKERVDIGGKKINELDKA